MNTGIKCAVLFEVVILSIHACIALFSQQVLSWSAAGRGAAVKAI